MLQLEELKLDGLKRLEQSRQSKVLILAASSLEMEWLPELYNLLIEIGRTERLDVLLYGRGGEVNAARRIGLLLHEFTENLCFLVPYHCQSSCTILALSGHEIIAGDLSIFSPIDPFLNATDAEGMPGSLASEDVRLFAEMSKNWFGLDVKNEEVRTQLLASVAGSIFPTTLTSLYRSTLELRHIAEELLAFQLPDTTTEYRAEIVNQLLFGYHSHSYALTRKDLTEMGLTISRNEEVETITWEIAQELNSFIGGGLRQTPQDPRNDVLLSTSARTMVRQRHLDVIAPVWKEINVA
ncbi:MAG: hypothetical protein AAGA66_18275 [Bacteroidota bacterium]